MARQILRQGSTPQMRVSHEYHGRGEGAYNQGFGGYGVMGLWGNPSLIVHLRSGITGGSEKNIFHKEDSI